MKGAVDEAIGEFERVAKSHPGLKRVHYNLGMLYTQKGAQEKAMAEYEQEIVADGTFPPAYNNLGRILYERGEMVRAARCFRKAVRIDPRYIHAVNNLGLIYMEEGNYKEAVAEFTKALEIDPGYGAAARNLALAKEMLQHPAETCNRLGQLFYMQGNLDKAEQQFNKAVGHNPRYVVAIGNLGVISMKKGRYRDAARQFRQVIDIDPGDTDARRNLAMAEALLQGGVTPAAPEERR
jgi:tetratricopeptide (TPR) repeat protein